LIHTSWSQKLFSVGDTIPNISLPDYSGDSIKISDFQGTLLLIDFWASWNMQSRQIHSDFRSIYENYRNKRFKNAKKFNILSISLDKNKRHWELAIKSESMPWKNQVCDFYGWNSPIVQLYKIEQIPSNYLVEENGRIIGINLNFSELEKLLKDRQ